MKIRPVGADLFHADGWTDGRTDRQRLTDMTKLIVAFRNFANAPNNDKVCQCNESSDLKKLSNCCVCTYDAS
jgi:hypothetical protein